MSTKSVTAECRGVQGGPEGDNSGIRQCVSDETLDTILRAVSNLCSEPTPSSRRAKQELAVHTCWLMEELRTGEHKAAKHSLFLVFYDLVTLLKEEVDQLAREEGDGRLINAPGTFWNPNSYGAEGIMIATAKVFDDLIAIDKHDCLEARNAEQPGEASP